MTGGRGPGRRVATHRGQTGVDFLVGVGVFMLTVGFVVAFVPGMFSPFVGGQELSLVADRGADTLVGDLLAAPAPSVLDEGCTVAFFGVGSDAGCGFSQAETTGDGLASELGLTNPDSPRYNTVYRVNVTLERSVPGTPEREVLCGSDTPSPSVHTCGSGTRLAVGPAVTSTTESVVTTSRVVYVSGGEAILVVRVW